MWFLKNSNASLLVELLDTLDTNCTRETLVEQWVLRSPAQETGRGSISGSRSASRLLLNCRSATLCRDFLQLPTAHRIRYRLLTPAFRDLCLSLSFQPSLSQPRCSSQENHPSVSCTHPQLFVFPQRRAPFLPTFNPLVETGPISGFNRNPIVVLLHEKPSPLPWGSWNPPFAPLMRVFSLPAWASLSP